MNTFLEILKVLASLVFLENLSRRLIGNFVSFGVKLNRGYISTSALKKFSCNMKYIFELLTIISLKTIKSATYLQHKETQHKYELNIPVLSFSIMKENSEKIAKWLNFFTRRSYCNMMHKYRSLLFDIF